MTEETLKTFEENLKFNFELVSTFSEGTVLITKRSFLQLIVACQEVISDLRRLQNSQGEIKKTLREF